MTADGVAVDAPPPPAVRELRAGRAIAIFAAYLGVQLLVGMAIGMGAVVWIIAVHGMRALAGADGQETAASIIQAVAIPASVVGLVVAGGVVFLLARWALAGPVGAPAWQAIGWSRAARRQVLLAAVAGAIIAMVYLAVAVLAPPPPSTKLGPITSAAVSGGWTRHGWAFLALVLAPPLEEFLFRGILFTGIARSWNATGAAVLVTGLFVLLHATEIAAYLPAAMMVTVLGTVTLLARVATGSLVPAIALHGTYNLCIVLSVYIGDFMRRLWAS
jgi:membrane protease YdiL (CAAX protease family)